MSYHINLYGIALLAFNVNSLCKLYLNLTSHAGHACIF